MLTTRMDEPRRPFQNLKLRSNIATLRAESFEVLWSTSKQRPLLVYIKSRIIMGHTVLQGTRGHHRAIVTPGSNNAAKTFIHTSYTRGYIRFILFRLRRSLSLVRAVVRRPISYYIRYGAIIWPKCIEEFMNQSRARARKLSYVYNTLFGLYKQTTLREYKQY